MDQKTAGIEILTKEHFSNQRKPKEKVEIGWEKVDGAARSFANLKGWACVWGVLWKVVGEVKKLLYEQPMLFENPGAIVLLKKGEKFGLVQNYRMVGERLSVPKKWDKGYIAYLTTNKLWEKLFHTLGKWTWEAPMGLQKDFDETKGLEAIVRDIAEKEALEEAGCKIGDIEILGQIVDKPTFVAHGQYCVVGNVVEESEQKAEDLEIIGKIHFFSMSEIIELWRKGDFVDGRTMSALFLYQNTRSQNKNPVFDKWELGTDLM